MTLSGYLESYAFFTLKERAPATSEHDKKGIHSPIFTELSSLEVRIDWLNFIGERWTDFSWRLGMLTIAF